MNWQKLNLLSEQFNANVDALANINAPLASTVRAFTPHGTLVIAGENDEILIGRLEAQNVHRLPCRMNINSATEIVKRLCPSGSYTEPLLVAGLDQGWLWHLLYTLPVEAPANPGHKPPCYFLCRTTEEFYIALHLHDWRDLLSSGRARIFVGENAFQLLAESALQNPLIPLPKVSITTDAELWPAGQSLDTLSTQTTSALGQRMLAAQAINTAHYATLTPQIQAAKLASTARLRVLGITARYTTFLQHSMRDWLAAFQSMGHETLLIIEQTDYELLNGLAIAEACAAFKPDLILLIDHYRAELSGLPTKCPAVMWIQDYLPNIFKPQAGAAQTQYDYVIGYNRTECTTRFSYPADRFMPSMVVVNEDRFAPVELSEDDRKRYECDICFVSHASKSAQSIIHEQIQQNGPDAKPLLENAFERLKSIYTDGLCISHPLHVRAVIEQSCIELRLGLSADSMQRVVDLFTHRINNALFRHQVLDWAIQTGANVHLYGKGWEENPRFAKYAKGPADNSTQLKKIFRAARINLQATPHGAVHQRLLEGLAAGGFFLIRYVPGDMLERIYKPLWDWCSREGISTDEELMRRATPDVLKMLGQLQRTMGIDPFKLGMSLTDDLRTSADIGYVRSAAAVWPQYEEVAFDSRQSFHQKLSWFLANPHARHATASAMRDQVLSRLTYKAVNQKMLSFIADAINATAIPKTIAA